ncbi:MAG: MlaD family protein [Polyangia bacterium]|nr:MlaD family protein [Polyangia bacterium]
MSDERLNSLVGLVLLPLLGLALVAVLVLGQRPLRPTMGLVAEFEHVEQLQVGAKVMISNQVVGRVTGISFTERHLQGEGKRRVLVHFYVERRFAGQLFVNSPALVSSRALIGERHLELDAPAEQVGRPVRPGDVLAGTSPSYFDRMYNLGYSSLVAAQELGKALGPHWREAKARYSSVESELKSLESHRERVASLGDRAQALLGEAKKTLAALRLATTELRGFEAAGQALRSFGRRAKTGAGQMISDVERLVDRLEVLVGALRGRIPRALDAIKARSDSIAGRMGQVMRWLTIVERAISQGEGTIGAFLQEKELFDDFKVSGKIIRQEIWRTIARPRKTSPQGSPVVP